MPDRTSVSRTLVKSPPELWAEVSDPAALGRHLEPFGEIRITRAEPEHTVAWEGESASGTVELEPAGWGTRVTLGAVPAVAEQETAETASVPEPEPEPPAAVTPQPEPPAAVAPEPEPPAASAPVPEPARRRFLARLAFWRRRAPKALARPAVEPAPLAPGPESEPVPAAPEPPDHAPPADPGSPALEVEPVLTSTLDALGAATRRPFSRG